MKLRTKLIGSVLIDLLLINIALLLTIYTSNFLNLDFAQHMGISGTLSSRLIAIIVTVTVVRGTISFILQCHKQVWRFASTYEFTLLTTSIGLSTALLIPALLIITSSMTKQISIIDITTFQLLDGFYNCILTYGLKFSPRLLEEWQKKPIVNPRKRVLIIGAGDVGVNVLRSMHKNPDKG